MFFKHVGTHNNRKVVIVQRSIPEDPHMAAVMYTDNVPTHYHDDVMALLESAEGQNSKEFMDIMNRRLLNTGAPMLVTLVREGYIKKAQCSQIIVRPNNVSAIRLDELNTLTKQIDEGTEATKKLASIAPEQLVASAPHVLTDEDIANKYKEQAAQMRRDADRLLAEAASLDQQASDLVPVVVGKVSRRGRKPTKTVNAE